MKYTENPKWKEDHQNKKINEKKYKPKSDNKQDTYEKAQTICSKF